jgi:hypothetical protein
LPVTRRCGYLRGEIAEEWLEQHFPERKDKVLHRIRAIRGGSSMTRISRPECAAKAFYAEEMAKLFELACRKAVSTSVGPTF